jgi:putative nucleotidyltransferase with HDIG domain
MKISLNSDRFHMDQKNQMYPVLIDELMAKPMVQVNLYVKLSDDKFVLIARAGANTSTDHLLKFKEKGLTYLYAKTDEFRTLVKHNISVAGMTVGIDAIDNLSKLSVIENATQSVFQEVQGIGIDSGVISHARLVAEASLTVIAGAPKLSELVMKFSGMENGFTRHALMVSMVSTMLGQGHDWVKQSTLEKLALGGLLHDIGKVKLPPDLLHKDAERMPHDERVIYRSHPELGRQLLSQVKDLPDDVLLMVYEHHELADGSGYPRGLKDFQISPLARVVTLANSFCELAVRKDDPLTIFTARRALDEIEQKTYLYNRDAIRALRRLVNGETLKKAG